MAKKVLSLSPLPAEIVKLLIQQVPGVPDFEVIPGNEMSAEELKKAFSEADVVLGDYTFQKKITADVIAVTGNLKFIQQPGAGYQHIDVDACTVRGIKLANTGGANAVSVAEHTIAWGLYLLKNMLHAHISTKSGGWEQMRIKPAELKGKVWGIVGFGRIGRAVAERLKAFQLSRILYFDTYRQVMSVEQDLGVEYAEMNTILGQADIISLHAPLTDATSNMINEGSLNSMKQGAYLINVARAELVDEKALAEAIKKGKIAGAGIDVFSEEPVSMNNPLLGVESEKLLLSPHVAGVTDEASMRIINMATANIARVLKGESPESLVN
ncbi:MAG: hydroxyacid dehydrogenase [Deltaproteobacteria bacterium HGW-Deltaproteobacteria-12]|jgi:glyoxylate reductase|nr:MAG: hydroxyacid dehydrogenase [Deltaproteobacteria bacterium HGW-Deltaproteobacteria-12]